MARDDLQILALGDRLSSSDATHLLGSLKSTDLNVNLMRFTADEGIEQHVNREVDVLIVALDGEGTITVDGSVMRLEAGQSIIIPKGTARSIRAAGERFAYLTCHGQRRGMMPTVRKQ